MDIYNQKNTVCKIYDFMQWGKISFCISGILLLSSCIIIKLMNFNWGLDFTGGTVIEIHAEKNIELKLMNNILIDLGLIDSKIQYFGTSKNILIRTPYQNTIQNNKNISDEIIKIMSLKKNNVIIKRMESVGPSVGRDLKNKGFLALIFSLIAILIYISLRFSWRLGIAIIIALIHDLIIILGFLSFLHIQIDLNTIASLLSVIGYSLNDSIVVSDRIRENFLKMHLSAYKIINLSISQTIGRTIITSSTILIVGLILLIFGGLMLKNFSITMIIGIFIGTISSIYISSILALKFGLKSKNMLLKKDL